MKIFKKKSLTQQNKAVSVQEIMYRSLQGMPLNVQVRPTFDGDFEDDDFSSPRFSEFSDKHEVAEAIFQEHDILQRKAQKIQQQKVESNKNSQKLQQQHTETINNQKGGIEKNETEKNEKKTQD